MNYKFNTIIPHILILTLVFFLHSCINLREDYPKINYYELKSIDNKGFAYDIDGIIQIRDVIVPPSLDNEFVFVNKEDGSVKKLYYNRWSESFNLQFDRLLLEKFNTADVFNGGVISQSSIIIPNYILEVELLQMQIFDTPSENYIDFKAKISLLNYNSKSLQMELIFTKLYDIHKTRENSKISNIFSAINELSNDFINQIIQDIVQEVKK